MALLKATALSAALATTPLWTRKGKTISRKFEFKDSDHGRLFQVQVYLDDLDSAAVEVELFADELDGQVPERCRMTRGERLVGANGWIFTAQVKSPRPAEHFTPRVIARHPDLAIPLECAAIRWQR